MIAGKRNVDVVSLGVYDVLFPLTVCYTDLSES